MVVSTALFTAHANAQVTLYDNLDNVPFDSYWFSPLGLDRVFAQQFLVGDIAVVDSVTVKVQRTGSGPTGSVGLELWRDNGSDEPLPAGNPNSIVAEIGTIDVVTQLPVRMFADIEFDGLGLELEPNTPYWVVMDFSGVSGINGAHQSIGWGGAWDEVPGPPFPPPGYDPTLGTNDAAFTHTYSNATPSWQDVTDYLPPQIFYMSMAVEAIPGGLQPGDSDQDLDFDQMDLIQVQQAAKFLTGQAATWGEGDWDGAPGGEPGNPPTGDGLFDQIDVIAALGAGKFLTGPYAADQAGGTIDDGQTSLIYNAATGELAVDSPVGLELTSINVDSAAGIFTGEAAANLGGSFDNDSDGNIFKATFGSSFGSLSFGNVAQDGLAEDFVLADLTVIGSLAGGGDLGNVDLVYVPEPTSVLLLAIGLAIGLLYLTYQSVRLKSTVPPFLPAQ